MFARRTIPLVPLVAVAFLAACTSGVGSPAAGSGGVSSGSVPVVAGATSSPADSAGDAGAGSSVTGDGSVGTVDVCQLATAADVEQLFPGAVTAAPEPQNANGCSYVFAGEDQGLTIEVVVGDDASTFWTGNIAPQGVNTIALSGIGDKAMRAPGTLDLVALHGATFCEIEASSQVSEFFHGLATPDTSDVVPDDSATAIAQKLGTLCNTIFAAR